VSQSSSRLSFIRGTLSTWWVRWFAPLIAFFALYDLCLSQFIPEELAKKAPKIWMIVDGVIGFLPWWGWTLVLAGMLVLASFEYNYRRAVPPRRLPPIESKEPTATTTRIKYSSEQIIAIEYRPPLGDWSLNLDNVATLEARGARDLSSIELILAETAPVTIAHPQPNRRYSAGGAEMSFPGAGIKGVQIKSASMLVGKNMQRFVFRVDDPTHRTHTIAVGTRRFSVMLRRVIDKSTPDLSSFEYVFGISEE
jgi:hypothetical protein